MNPITTASQHYMASFHARLDDIKALPVDMLADRGPLMAQLLADLVYAEVYPDGPEGESLLTRDGIQSQPFWRAFKVYAEGLGFQFLGAGHFSAAFSHKMLPKRVIKVGFKKEDSGAAYAAYCRMSQGQPGIPTIYDIQRHQACYTVILDKLNKYTGTCNNVLQNLFEASYRTLHGHGEPSASQERKKLLNFYMSQLTFEDLETIETVHKIREFFRGIAAFDLHEDNVMVHPDTGALVITDPVSFTELNERGDEFRVDPVQLAKEIEEVRQERLLERCRARWARHHDPIELKQRKEVGKARRQRHKRIEREESAFRANQKAKRERNVQNARFKEAHGYCDDMNVVGVPFWCSNGVNTVKARVNHRAQKAIQDQLWAVAQGLQVLPMDARLDARFIG